MSDVVVCQVPAMPPIEVVARRYAIESRIGTGGMGNVYLARDLHAGNRPVALKILREDRLDPERKGGLATEYATLARLRHPHVEAVIDFGRDEKRGLYIAKEYLPGRDLMDATEGWTVPECLVLSLQLFRALAFLHARHLVHNDIKPDNVLVVRDDGSELGFRAVLIDFGIASRPAETANDAPVSLVGTLGYLAPERIRGGKPDARTDLYSAGILMYRLLTRSFPFHATSQAHELLAFHLRGHRPRPSEKRAEIPAGADELVRRLLARDREDRFASAHAVLQAIGHVLGRPEPLETEATHEGYVQSAPLVGRDDELEGLAAFVERGITGRRAVDEPGVAIVLGETGMGKSRLLGEILVRARLAGAQVVTGSGRKHGGGLGPLRSVLRTLVGDDEAQEVLRTIERSDPDERADAREVLQSLGRMLLDRCRNVVLAVEDLHHTDEMTLDLLAYVARLLRQSPTARLVCLLTARTPSFAPLDRLLEDVARDGTARLRRLGPLTEPQAAAFVEQVIGERPPAPFVRVLLERTGGDPSAIQEGLKLLLAAGLLPDRMSYKPRRWELCADALPDGVMAILAGRLAVLHAEARSVLRALATAWRPLPLALVAAGASMDPGRAGHLLPDLAKRDLVLTRVVGGEPVYLPAHERLAQAVRLEVAPEEQAAIHDRLAKAIESLPAAPQSEWLPDLAHHAVHSGRAAFRAGQIVAMGRRLEATYAPEEARRLYDALLQVRGLDGGTRVQIHLRLGGIHKQAGRWREAARSLAVAARSAGRLGMRRERAEALRYGAALANRYGHRWKAEVRAIKALLLYESCGDPVGVAKTKLLLAQFLYQDNDHAHALEMVTEALRLCREGGDLSGMGRAQNLRGMILWRLRRIDEAAHGFQEAYRLAGLVPALANLGNARLELGDFAEANRILRDALGLAKRQGWLRERAIVEVHMASLRVEEGQLVKARHLLHSAVEAFEGLEEKGQLAATLAAAAGVALHQGAAAEAARLVARARSTRDGGSACDLPGALRPRAILALKRGDLEEAHRTASRAARSDALWSEPRGFGLAALILAEVALEEGRRPELLRQLCEARGAFGSAASTAGLLWTDLLLARSECLWGSPREAGRLLREVVRTATARGLRLQAATALAASGGLRAADGDLEAGLAELASAEAYARGEGASWLGAEVHLARAGLLLGQGDLPGATATLEAADRMIGGFANLPLFHAARVLQVKVLAASGSLEECLRQAVAVDRLVAPTSMIRLRVEAALALSEAAAASGEASLAREASSRGRELAREAGYGCYGA